MSRTRVDASLMVAGGLGLIAGSFMGWAVLLGTSKSGIDGGDGWMTLAGALVVVAFAVRLLVVPRPATSAALRTSSDTPGYVLVLDERSSAPSSEVLARVATASPSTSPTSPDGALDDTTLPLWFAWAGLFVAIGVAGVNLIDIMSTGGDDVSLGMGMRIMVIAGFVALVGLLRYSWPRLRTSSSTK